MAHAFDITNYNPKILWDIEATLLVSSVQHASIAHSVANILKPEHFTDTSFGSMWKLFLNKLHKDGTVPNLVMMQLEGQQFNIDIDMSDLIDYTIADPELAETYALSIKDLWLRNKLRDSFSNMHLDGLVLDEALETARTIVNEISNQRTNVAPALDLHELGVSLLDYVESDDEVKIYQFGMPEIDKDIVDLAPGNTVIIGAQPSVGKTSLGIFMAMKNAMVGVPTHMFSLEMTEHQITSRFQSYITGIPAKTILSKNLTYKELQMLQTANERFKTVPMRVTPYPDMHLDTLIQSMRDSKLQFGTELFLVDYIQLINFQGRTKREEASFIAQKLKSVAMELDACIVLMSQLSRNNSVEPSMFDLKETSDLEQSASLVVLLYGDKMGVADGLKTEGSYPVFFKIDKQRNGEKFKKTLHFMPKSMQFMVADFDTDAAFSKTKVQRGRYGKGDDDGN